MQELFKAYLIHTEMNQFKFLDLKTQVRKKINKALYYFNLVHEYFW